MKITRFVAAIGVALLLAIVSAWSQQSPSGQGNVVQGTVINRSTLNNSPTITTGNTFQTVLASILGTTTQRQSLTIQNNNTTTDNCWVFIGGGSATAARSILLQPGQAYTRYWPYVPSDAIQATCATSNDTLYVDNQ